MLPCWYSWPSVLFLAAHYEMLRPSPASHYEIAKHEPEKYSWIKRIPSIHNAWSWRLCDSQEAEAQRMGLSRIDEAEAAQIILDTNAYIRHYHITTQKKVGMWTVIDDEPVKLRLANLQVEKNKLASLRYKKTGECTCAICRSRVPLQPDG